MGITEILVIFYYLVPNIRNFRIYYNKLNTSHILPVKNIYNQFTPYSLQEKIYKHIVSLAFFMKDNAKLM